MNPGMFNEAFLKIDEDKTTYLNDKIKKVRLADFMLLNRRYDMMKEVSKVLLRQ